MEIQMALLIRLIKKSQPNALTAGSSLTAPRSLVILDPGSRCVLFGRAVSLIALNVCHSHSAAEQVAMNRYDCFLELCALRTVVGLGARLGFTPSGIKNGEKSRSRMIRMTGIKAWVRAACRA